MQEEEADENWSLFAFVYEEWLSKTKIIVSKRNEMQKSKPAGLEEGNFPDDDMTDQVSTDAQFLLRTQHYNRNYK
jgi:hypothetical protein